MVFDLDRGREAKRKVINVFNNAVEGVAARCAPSRRRLISTERLRVAMEFYRDKKIQVTLETKLNPDEIVNRLLPHIEPKTPWYKLRVFPEPSMKSFAGEINRDGFMLVSKDYLSIKGLIRKKDNECAITMIFSDHQTGSRAPEYWMGSMSNAVFGMGVISIASFALLKYLLNLHFSTSLVICFLLVGMMIYQMIKINKVYIEKLELRVDENQKLLFNMFAENKAGIK